LDPLAEHPGAARAPVRYLPDRTECAGGTEIGGLEDTRRTLKRRDWLALPEQGMGIVVHDVHRERDY